MDDLTRLIRCVRCGAALVDGAVEDYCPACRAAMAETPTHAPGLSTSDAPTMAERAGLSSSEQPTFLSAGGRREADGPPGPRPISGAAFGPYRIARPLGSGGMGDVYEAEHAEHGRRVALKVLGQRLATGEDRARFLSEGEIAASITHPNTVYVYGSEEIAGSPVIVMELLSGGTLKDLVQQRGPLPPKDAVDLILQVIAGLEAAQTAGILHRDVKPANCFIDRDGRVKVGDFGLSISTSGRGGAATGMFQGTPQFAPPEQIRGEALDVRADIYAVGATLFYLLTGQPPFDDCDLTTLIARVKAEVPRSPRAMRVSIPAALAAVVIDCLAKDRAERPSSHAVLADRLRPFSRMAAAPAPLGRRLLAGFLDQVTIVVLNAPLAGLLVLQHPDRSASRWGVSIAQILSILIYFGVLEGRWGAAIGKRVCGLVVARLDGGRPGVARGMTRAAMFSIHPLLLLIPIAVMGAQAYTRFTLERPGLTVLMSGGSSVVQLLFLFSTARRRNGFAAIHDLATGTRVLVRRPAAGRAGEDRAHEAVAVPEGSGPHRFGSFDVIAPLGATGGGDVWLATDPRLKRKVWILRRSPGAAPISSVLRDMGRPARLRWLGGRRALDEAWDAFEAFDGRPLTRVGSPQPWRLVKHWLVDLAVEVDAGLADGSLPPLTTDRVWITAAGAAKILDFRVPGAPAPTTDEQEASQSLAQTFLAHVAADGLAGGSSPVVRFPGTLPLSARATLDRLTARGCGTTSAMVSQVTDLLSRPDEVAPWRRAMSVALGGVAPLALGLLGLVAAYALRQAPSGAEALALDLGHLSELSAAPNADRVAERHALETYIAANYGPTIANELTWTIVASGKAMRDYRPLAIRAMADHPSVTPEELTAAKATLAPFLAEEAKVQEGSRRRARIAPFVVPTFLFVVGFAVAAAFGVALAVVLRGGLLLRSFGMAVVARTGEQASRLRAGCRAAVAWAPVALFVYAARAADITFKTAYSVGHPGMLALAAASFAVFLVGAGFGAVGVGRSIQDFVAGTRVVPR
jgi:uncharacterized RDD family membrane protein YckC